MSGRQKMIEACLENLSKLGLATVEGVRRPLILEKVSSMLGITMKQVESILQSCTPASTHRQINDDLTHNENTEDLVSSTVSRSRLLAEQELLAICMFDPTEASASLREHNDFRPTVEQFQDPVTAAIAATILPHLLAGTPITMQETLSGLNEPAKMIASSLFFDGQRLCEEAGSVMIAIESALQAFEEKLNNQSINTQVHQVKQVVDPTERAQKAQEALESIRQQKTTWRAS